MKANFNQPFRDSKGNEVKGSPIIADALAQHLYAGTGLKPTGNYEDDAAAKYAYFRLSQKVQNATDETDYTAEELTSIKRVAMEALVPGAYGQVCDIIEQGK